MATSDGDCLDSRISLPHISALKSKNSTANSSAIDAPVLAYSTTTQPHTIFPKLNLVAQPPPSQALTSLRTIVLLN